MVDGLVILDVAILDAVDGVFHVSVHLDEEYVENNVKD